MPASSGRASPVAEAAEHGGGNSSSSGGRQRSATGSSLASQAASTAISGGVAAAAAQVVSIPLFTWMHTITTYQHRYGGSLGEVASALYKQGGVRRFYRGAFAALIFAPLARFGGIAATDGAFEAMAHLQLPAAATAAVASGGAAASRAVLMPLSAWTASAQVHGKDGFSILLTRAKRSPASLWQGTGSAIAFTWLGHWVWCTADREMRQNAPDLPPGEHNRHALNALIGFTSSVISDAVTNPFRVLCTIRQTSEGHGGGGALKSLAKDGLLEFFGRGLATRVLTSGTQGAFLTVGWQALAARSKE